MILINVGRFYSEGKPVVVIKNKTLAKRWLKENNYKKCRDIPNTHLYEKEMDGYSIWARMDEIEGE